MHHTLLAELCRTATRKRRAILYDAGDRIDLPSHPPPGGSFGFIDDWVTLDRPFKGAYAWIVLPFEPKRLGWIDAQSLRLFRFDAKDRRFDAVPFGLPHAAEPAVCAAVDRPGVYGVVGLNEHPLVSEAIRRLCEARSLSRGLPEPMRAGLRDRTCDLILCAPDMQKIAASRDLLEKFAESRGRTLPTDLPPALPYSLGPNETICDRCHGIDLDDFPDCHIVVEPPSRACKASRWESVGPDHISGAMRLVLVDPTDRCRLYSVAANGGLWKLDNVDDYPERAWRPLTDDLGTRFRTMAVAPSRGRVLYAANVIKELASPAINVYSEIYRSVNRGLSWQAVHDAGMGVVHRLAVHTANHDVVFAATSTGLWRRDAHPGSWVNVFADDCLDVTLDPEDSSIVYLGVRTVGVFKSFTSGAVWPIDPIVAFDPVASGGRRVIKIALGRRNTDGSLQRPAARTVAVRFGNEVCINHQSGEGGAAAWQRDVPVVMIANPDPPPPDQIDDVPNLLGGGNIRRSDTSPRQSSEWCNCLAVDAFDPRHLIVGSASLMARANEGTALVPLASAHEDQHSLIFDPDTPGLAYLANDGGLFSSIDGGNTWGRMRLSDTNPAPSRGLNLARGLVTSEIRHSVVRSGRAVAAIDHTGFVLTDDFSGRWQFLFEGPDASGRHRHEESFVFGCPASLDRYYVINMRKDDDPTKTTGRLAQLDFTRTGGFVNPPAFTFLSPLRAAIPPQGSFFPDNLVYREHLPGPFAARFSESDGRRLLLLGTELQPPVGFTIQSLRLDRNGTNVLASVREAVNADPFFAMLFVPSDPDRALAISSSGQLFERDFSEAGAFAPVAGWDRGGLGGFVSRLIAVPHPSLSLYALTQRAIGRFDDVAGAWTTVQTWPDPEEPLMSLVAHPTRRDTLFLGTSRNLYLSEDRGSSWRAYALGLPSVPVTELTFDGGYLYAATYGRGLWRCTPC